MKRNDLTVKSIFPSFTLRRSNIFLIGMLGIWVASLAACTPEPLQDFQESETEVNTETSPPTTPVPTPYPLLPATLRVEGQEQLAGIGTYCWPERVEGDTITHVCRDMVGIPTPHEPLQVQSTFTAQLELPLEASPSHLNLRVTPVTPEDEAQGPDEWRWWEFGEGEDHVLPLSSQAEIELTLQPGLYVWNLFAAWENVGDVSYGFLVEVESAGSTSEPTNGLDRQEEAILILEPGPGSRVTSPVRVAGIADPTFEQALAVSMVLDDGSEIALSPAQIAAEVGNRGPFELDLPFTVSGERQAFIQVFATSARDGGITHLASVGVTIADSGPKNIIPIEPYPERIEIFQPKLNETISGGVVHVEGFALASFEGTLVVEVLDENGDVIGSRPLIVAAPDIGQPGPYAVDVPYQLDAGGPGRIVVRDPSPAFGGDAHLASVEVTLEP